MQSLLAVLVFAASSSMAQAGISGTAIVNIFQGTCATQTSSDVQVNQVVITPEVANFCSTGALEGLSIANSFMVQCASTSTIGKVQIFAGTTCAGSVLPTNCVDGTGEAAGFYHLFACSTQAPTQSPTTPTSKAPTNAPTNAPTPATAAPVSTTSAPVTAAPVAASTSAPTVATKPPTTTVTKAPTPTSTKIPTEAPTPTAFLQCTPQNGMKKNACNKKIKTCDALGISMKWTGTGCSADGQKLNDGGCQCSGYCGFNCKVACNGDKSGECVWDDVNRQCLVKATGEPGEPIPFCKP